MNKFTPGPWHTGEFEYKIVIYGADCFYLGSVSSPIPDYLICEDEVTQANARLIAAAPELLDVCEQLLYIIDIYSEEIDGKEASITANHARFIIAKAKGEA